jgi:GNAT superfamily N-acetyltransferase
VTAPKPDRTDRTAAAGITVRPAGTADVEALVQLRVANARAHIALEPAAYRVPDLDAVRRHFDQAAVRDATLVADLDGRVVGMVEIVRNPDPPDHQIVRPQPSALIHTVVSADARGHGAGSALLEAAHRWAAGHGITRLSAGIHHRNAGAVRFYGRHGYTGSGISLSRLSATRPGDD